MALSRQSRVAWAAGFFDGEGCVSIGKFVEKRTTTKGVAKQWTRYQLCIVIMNKAKEPLDRFNELFEGSLNSVEKPEYETVYWRYRAASVKARKILKELLPYLTCKTTAAEVGIAFQDYMDETAPYYKCIGRSEEENEYLAAQYTVMRGINKRNPLREGWPQKGTAYIKKGELAEVTKLLQ